MSDSSDIVLRAANVGDVELLTTLIHTAFAEYEGQLDPPSGAHAETAEQVAAKLSKGGAFLALMDGEYAGCVLYYPQDDALYLGRLAVLPEFRGSGAGYALVAAVEGTAVKQGWKRVQLGVRIALPRNRVYFEKLGYRVVAYASHAGYEQPTSATLEKVIDEVP